MTNGMTPNEFALKIQPFLSANQFLFGVTDKRPETISMKNPEEPASDPYAHEKYGTFRLAFKRAWESINFFTPSEPIARAMGNATSQVGQATANAVGAVGKGISRGFQWGVFIIMMLVALYILGVVSPLLPRRA